MLKRYLNLKKKIDGIGKNIRVEISDSRRFLIFFFKINFW